MELREIKISACNLEDNTIFCAHCRCLSSGALWSTETDTQGNNFGQCPECGKESLLVLDDEYTYGDVI